MSDYYATPHRPQQPPQTPPHLPMQSMRSPISQPFPQQQYPPQQRYPPQPQGKRARIVLVVASVVMFAVAGVFGWLYIGADGDHDAAVAQLDQRSAQLADTREQADTAEDAQEDAEKRNADLEAEQTTLSTCVKAVQHYLWDGLEGTAEDAALDAMFTACQ